MVWNSQFSILMYKEKIVNHILLIHTNIHFSRLQQYYLNGLIKKKIVVLCHVKNWVKSIFQKEFEISFLQKKKKFFVFLSSIAQTPKDRLLTRGQTLTSSFSPHRPSPRKLPVWSISTNISHWKNRYMIRPMLESTGGLLAWNYPESVTGLQRVKPPAHMGLRNTHKHT